MIIGIGSLLIRSMICVLDTEVGHIIVPVNVLDLDGWSVFSNMIIWGNCSASDTNLWLFEIITSNLGVVESLICGYIGVVSE